MVTEIELKAHISDYEKLKNLLSETAVFLHAFEKADSYWFADNTGQPSQGLRLRAEKRTFPDGREESLTLATYKRKEVRDGIEINDEREFSVDPASEFEDFLRRMALKPGLFKEKRGWAFSKDGITAELVEVPGLGWFIELEIVVDSASRDAASSETFADGKKRLLDLLTSLGIAREEIESRYYSEMLETDRGLKQAHN